MHQAVQADRMALVIHLIALGTNVDAKDHDGCTPLMLAHLHSHMRLAMVLVCLGADLCEDDRKVRVRYDVVDGGRCVLFCVVGTSISLRLLMKIMMKKMVVIDFNLIQGKAIYDGLFAEAKVR